MGYVRVRPPTPDGHGGACAVRHPNNPEMFVVPDPKTPYRDDDPLVLAYPWMFVSDEELVEGPYGPRVERATRSPGERKDVRRA